LFDYDNDHDNDNDNDNDSVPGTSVATSVLIAPIGAGRFPSQPRPPYTPDHHHPPGPAMPRATLLRQRLLALFLAALFAFFSPLPGRFESLPDLHGIPALDLYLFGVWALVIAVAAWACSRGRD
jgi:hypothetical protein